MTHQGLAQALVWAPFVMMMFLWWCYERCLIGARAVEGYFSLCSLTCGIGQHLGTFTTSTEYPLYALAAYFAYCWWKDGGGDDMKRRLRELGQLFRPVRRTAPATA